jgi:pimeloyl-ACP methyl ester carboxylesterase
MRRTALLLLALVSVAVTLGGTAPAATSAQSGLVWTNCGGGFQCATLMVPVDYTSPGGHQLGLSVIRKPARDQANRIGSLLTNPGGPGGSGVEFTRYWANILDGGIRDHFDIVGFDPRGVGESSPVICHDSLQDYIGADPSPDTQAEWDALAAESKRFADACAQKHGALLPFLGTKNVARDMDRLREALGDARLNYVGYSYGTEIGQVYADLFPGRIRAMVLDGAVNLAEPSDERTLTQIVGFEDALNAFLAKCREDKCRLTKRGDPGEAVDELFKKAEAAPIPSKSADRAAGPGEVLIGLITPLYSEQGWPQLERAIEAGLNGDGSLLVRLTDDYLSRESNGDYANSQETNLAVNCVDQEPTALPKAFNEYAAAAARFAQVAPRLGPAAANGLYCAYWAAKPDPIGPVRAQGIPPIVVVSTSGDPATPYAWGVAVSRQLPGAVLISYGGEGHTVYGGGQDDCVDEAVDAYLLELKVPSPDTVCGDPEKVRATSAAPTPTTAPSPAPGAPPTPPPSASEAPAPPATGGPNAVATGGDRGVPWAWIAAVAVAAALLLGMVAVAAKARSG